MNRQTWKYLRERLQTAVRTKNKQSYRLHKTLALPWEKIVRSEVKSLERKLERARGRRARKINCVQLKISRAASIVTERIILNDAEGALKALKSFERKKF